MPKDSIVTEVLTSWSRDTAASSQSSREVMGVPHSPAATSLNEPATPTTPGLEGGDEGGGEGGAGGRGVKQSMQSVPESHVEYSAPGPPSSHSPSDE